jgi:hypothetical protein
MGVQARCQMSQPRRAADVGVHDSSVAPIVPVPNCPYGTRIADGSVFRGQVNPVQDETLGRVTLKGFRFRCVCRSV